MIAPLVRSTLVHRFAVERRRDPVRDAPVGGGDSAASRSGDEGRDTYRAAAAGRDQVLRALQGGAIRDGVIMAIGDITLRRSWAPVVRQR